MGEGNGNPLQRSCLENPMDRGAWRAAVRGVAKSDTTERQTLTNETDNRREPAVSLREFYSVLCGDLNGKEIQRKRQYMYQFKKKRNMKNNAQPFLSQKKKNCEMPLLLVKIRKRQERYNSPWSLLCSQRYTSLFWEWLAHLKFYLFIYLASQQILCKDYFL